MLPMTLIVIFSAGLWRFLSAALVGPKPLGGVIRWLVCALVILAPYITLARGLERGRRIEKRVYRYAE
jgi:hypothetical protein